MKLCGVYLILCGGNGKVYIGSAKDPEERWYGKRKGCGHLQALRKGEHYNTYLQRAFNKYGEASFNFRILELHNNRTEAYVREQYYLDSFQTWNRKIGFNQNTRAIGFNVEAAKAASKKGTAAYLKWVKENPEEAQKSNDIKVEKLADWSKNNPILQKEVYQRAKEGLKRFRENNPEEALKFWRKAGKAAGEFAKGKIWIKNSSGESQRVSRDEVEQFLNQGWERGRIYPVGRKRRSLLKS
jgi:group I intron endonuclease